MTVQSNPEPDSFKKMRTDPYFKGATVQPLLKTLFKNKQFKVTERYVICREVFKMIPIVIYSRKNYFLLDAFNDKIKFFRAAGLVEYWHFQNVDKKFLNSKIFDGPKVLTFDQLVGCFGVLVLGLLTGFISFIFEVRSRLAKSVAVKINFMRAFFNFYIIYLLHVFVLWIN